VASLDRFLDEKGLLTDLPGLLAGVDLLRDEGRDADAEVLVGLAWDLLASLASTLRRVIDIWKLYTECPPEFGETLTAGLPSSGTGAGPAAENAWPRSRRGCRR
jgi:hypothetical protein